MDAELKARWNHMFAQAEEFEAVEKIDEALPRCRLALGEIRAALAAATGEEDRRALERLEFRAERFVHRYEELFERWEKGIEERYEQYAQREAADYHAPLAVPSPLQRRSPPR